MPRTILDGVRNRWRRSFVASITVLVLLAVILFALVIGRLVREQIEDQAFDRAADTAQILARASFAPRLPTAAGARLSARDAAALDRQVQAARARDPLLAMRLWSRDGEQLYPPRSGRGSAGPGASAAPPVVRDALRGSSASEVTGDVLLTAVPVIRRAGGPISAALELRLPYGPVEEDIDDRTNRLMIALAVVALLAYLLALPGLIRASRALKAQYDPRRVEVVRDLKRAMKRGELALHFQPIVDAQTRVPVAAEGLVRWRHPRTGAVPPDKFIPIVEPTEAMWPLTLHLLDLGIAACRRWQDAGHDVAVAMNISGEVLPDRRLAGEIEDRLKEHGLPSHALEIEVTEGAVMRDPAAATKVLGRLTDLGIRVIAIDDFGTGYSSLARLHELPLDTLKIDQAFVKRMAQEGDAAVVCSIIELAHALNMKVIAEGAEDDATVTRLAELGCDYIQGYALSKPLPPEQFGEWLAGPVTV